MIYVTTTDFIKLSELNENKKKKKKMKKIKKKIIEKEMGDKKDIFPNEKLISIWKQIRTIVLP